MEQRTKEWFDARRNRVTASLVGAILGVAPYMSRENAMRRMVRDYHGAPSEFTGNVATEWGTYNEAGARFDFELETGISVRECVFFMRDDWAGASPDGLIGEDSLLEIKCPFGIRNDENPKFKTLDDLPHYFAQVQFQLWVTGRREAYFWQWSPKKTHLEVVLYSQNWIDKNIPLLRAFYDEYLLEIGNPEHLACPPEKKKRKISRG